MKSFFNSRHTRYTAVVMLFFWLMTLGIGFANACLLDEAREHHAPTAHSQATHHNDADEQAMESDHAVCITVCEAGQAAAVKTKPVNALSDLHTVSIAHCSALTVAVVDLNDRFVPSVVPAWCEPPVSIRFLRLTI